MAFPYFYEKNVHVLNHPVANTTFETILNMTDEEFVEWVKVVRSAILHSWDTFGCPLKSGLTEDEIIDQFTELANKKVMGDRTGMLDSNDPAKFDIAKKMFETPDLLDKSGKTIVVQNIQRDGSAIDQFFPTMMKTRINYSESDKGYSVYDLFADESKLKKLVTISRKCLKRDSFYYFSQTVQRNSDKELFNVSTVDEWVESWNLKTPEGYGYWVDWKKEPKTNLSSGYNQVEVDEQVHYKENGMRGYVRVFRLGQKVFPHAFKAFRIGDIQIAVNFPPMTAKYLYQKYTEHITDQDTIVVYDSSSGWGGRILGAMSYDRPGVKLHYVGNDPNPDNFIEKIHKTRYEVVAEFFNTNCLGLSLFSGKEENTYEIFRQGSENIHTNPKFKKYRGILDFVFTSPPYFNREAYSEDENQSYKKFSTYESWKNGFLRPTLETAYEFLKKDRYLVWNIADVLVGKNKDGSNRYLPLEQDTIDIMVGLGAEYIGTNKLALMNMPGQNRIKEDGTPNTRCFARIKNRKGIEEWIKTEPILVFRKR
jgi:hypothetical protein